MKLRMLTFNKKNNTKMRNVTSNLTSNTKAKLRKIRSRQIHLTNPACCQMLHQITSIVVSWGRELFETENISSIFLRIFTWISPLSATKVWKCFLFFYGFSFFHLVLFCFFIYIFIYFFEQLKNYKNIFIRMCSSIILVLVTRSLHCCSRNSCNLTSISTWALKGVIVFHNRCK